MKPTFDWSRNRDMWVRVLESKTGDGLDAWNRRIEALDIADKETLRAWLEGQGVTGYARSVLLMERFGYPDFVRATADELIDRQYQDRPQLRPIHDAIVDICGSFGELAVQARKTYTSLLTPRRTFVRLQPTARWRLDVRLRLEGCRPAGRLVRSRAEPTMPVQVGLASLSEVDDALATWLARAYAENS